MLFFNVTIKLLMKIPTLNYSFKSIFFNIAGFFNIFIFRSTLLNITINSFNEGHILNKNNCPFNSFLLLTAFFQVQ